MAFNQEEFDGLVKMMLGSLTDSTVNQIVALMSSSNVNKYASGEPLIIYYLRACMTTNLDILTAFATHGCDFQVLGRDGQTPLHVLVAKEMDGNKMASVELLIAHGGYPCAVDCNGNNVLMVAVLNEQIEVVSYLFTNNRPIDKLLVFQKNKAGDDIVSLFLKSPFKRGDIYRIFVGSGYLEHLVKLGADVSSVDHNGDTFLHRLVRCPEYGYLPSQYFHLSDQLMDLIRVSFKEEDFFTCHTNVLIKAGANICHRNNSGLIPLQVALSTRSKTFRSAGFLLPFIPDENELELLVPRPDMRTLVNEPSNLSVQVWFVAQLIKFGFTSANYTLPIARACKYYTITIAYILIRRYGVKPTVEDLRIVTMAGEKDEIELYIEDILPKELRDFKYNIPDLVSQIISLKISYFTSIDGAIEKLVSNGFEFTMNDLKRALDKKCLRIARHLLMNMDSSFAENVKHEIPDILIQVLRLYQECKWYLSVNGVENLVAKIVKQVKVSMNYVNHSNDTAIQCVMDLVRKDLHEPEASKLFDLLASQENFDAEINVQLDGINHSPLELAIRSGSYVIAAKLILAGADYRGIQFDNLRRVPTALKLLKLLYHLGIYVDIADDDLISDWAGSQPVKPLQELAAMAVRRNCSRTELGEIFADIELPDEIHRYFKLKHLTLND